MALAAASPNVTDAPPDSLHVLLDRFDPTVFDAPQGKARIRLIIPDDGQWDVLADAGGATLVPADSRASAAATLTADRGTWDSIACVSARRDGGVSRRPPDRFGYNFDLGAGTARGDGAGVTGPARLRFERITTAPRASLLHSHRRRRRSGGADPRPGRHEGARSCRPSRRWRARSDDRARPPGIRRSFKPLRGPIIRGSSPARSSIAGCPRARAGPRDRQQHGRTGLAWRSACASRARRTARPVGAVVGLATARPWAPLVRLLRPELGLVQLAPALGGRGGGASHHSRRGRQLGARRCRRVPARLSHAARARRLLRGGAPDLLEEPHGAKGFWTRLAPLEPPRPVRLGQARLAGADRIRGAREATLPTAHHLVLDCGHVPQIERPAETHAAIADFLREGVGR